MTSTTMAFTSAFTAVDHTFHAPALSVEQVLILDHAATLLQYLSHSASKADGKNSTNASADDIDDKRIVARINGLLKCYGRYGE